MISEIDLLRDDIPRLEEKFGADNPFVEVLKAHLAELQNNGNGQPSTRKPRNGFENLKRFLSQLGEKS